MGKSLIIIMLLTSFNLMAQKIDQGTLDLRSWDGAPISLTGDWTLYWNQLLGPENAGRKYGLVPVPKKWNRMEGLVSSFPGVGAATYRLSIKNVPKGRQLGLLVSRQQSAVKIHFGDRFVGEIGKTAFSKASGIPRYETVLYTLPPLSGDVTLTMEISNFHHWEGGTDQPLKIGFYSQMRSEYLRDLIFELLIAGSLLAIAFYHLILFFFEKKEKSIMIFFWFCLIAGLRTLVTESVLLQYLAPVPWIVLEKLEYFSFSVMVPLVAAFLKSMFPKEVNNKVFYVMWGEGILYAIVTLVASPFFLYPFCQLSLNASWN